MFERILLATDFSPHAQKAAKVAFDLARESGKRLWALAVLEPVEEPLEPADEPPGVNGKAWETVVEKEERNLEAELKSRLHAAMQEAEASGIAVTEMVREGDPTEEIVAAAREVNAEVIVMGSHSNRTLWDVLLGSVTEKVVKHAPCPVIAVSHTPTQRSVEKGPVLLVTDFSDAAEQAVKVAASLAKERGERLIVLTVTGRGLGKRIASLGLEHLLADLRAQGTPAEGMLRCGKRGHIYPEIVRVAEEVQSSIIVMGSHSRLTVHDVLLGYVAENVSKHAPCPVLIVSDNTAG